MTLSIYHINLSTPTERGNYIVVVLAESEIDAVLKAIKLGYDVEVDGFEEELKRLLH